jgi:CheY-like chemotaxis protein
MPIMDGMTATSRIRKYEREQKIPGAVIIALTGLASANARLEAMESGIDHYLTKPVNFRKLIELLPGL